MERSTRAHSLETATWSRALRMQALFCNQIARRKSLARVLCAMSLLVTVQGKFLEV